MCEFLQILLMQLLRMFNALFDWIYQLTSNKPQIYHIHQKGWKCILGDLDQAQAKGLGMALH